MFLFSLPKSGAVSGSIWVVFGSVCDGYQVMFGVCGLKWGCLSLTWKVMISFNRGGEEGFQGDHRIMLPHHFITTSCRSRWASQRFLFFFLCANSLRSPYSRDVGLRPKSAPPRVSTYGPATRIAAPGTGWLGGCQSRRACWCTICTYNSAFLLGWLHGEVLHVSNMLRPRVLQACPP